MTEDLRGRLSRLSAEVDRQASAAELAREEIRRLTATLGDVATGRLDDGDRSAEAREQSDISLNRRLFARSGGLLAVGAAAGIAIRSPHPAAAAAAPHPLLVTSRGASGMTPAAATDHVSIFNALNYGAVADGATNNTAALQKIRNVLEDLQLYQVPGPDCYGNGVLPGLGPGLHKRVRDRVRAHELQACESIRRRLHKLLGVKLLLREHPRLRVRSLWRRKRMRDH
jgi:hypothetical protein